MRPRAPGQLYFLVLAALCACKSRELTSTPTPAGDSASTITAPQPTGEVTTRRLADTGEVAERRSADTWLVVEKSGVELGVIELRAGAPPSLTVETESPDAAALKAKLAEIGGPNGIPLDMHLPPPSGTGRGAYGTSITKYGDPLYRHAVKERLEPDFRVKEVPQLDDPSPPEGLKRVTVSRSGAKVGSIDFASTPPKLTIDTDTSDGTSLKNAWENIQTRDALKVRYHTLKDAKETLVTMRAKPGDASYPQVVVLCMMVESYYLARYAYALEFAR